MANTTITVEATVNGKRKTEDLDIWVGSYSVEDLVDEVKRELTKKLKGAKVNTGKRVGWTCHNCTGEQIEKSNSAKRFEAKDIKSIEKFTIYDK